MGLQAAENDTLEVYSAAQRHRFDFCHWVTGSLRVRDDRLDNGASRSRHVWVAYWIEGLSFTIKRNLVRLFRAESLAAQRWAVPKRGELIPTLLRPACAMPFGALERRRHNSPLVDVRQNTCSLSAQTRLPHFQRRALLKINTNTACSLLLAL